jgi:NAD(P)-dependent dehydrogenase (short-subunit alcohol dehydrogenase family)
VGSAGRILLEFQAVMEQFLRIEHEVLRAHLSGLVALPPVRVAGPGGLDRGAGPGDVPGVGPQAAVASTTAVGPDHPTPPLRLTLRATERPRPAAAAVLARDHAILVTDDGHGVAAVLADRLRRDGHRVARVANAGADEPARDTYCSSLDSPAEVDRVVGRVTASCGPIGALVHLIPLGGVPDYEHLRFAAWSQRLSLETRTLFLLSRALRPSLASAADRGGAAVVAATAMGGAFGSDPAYLGRSFFPGQGGVVGFAKCLAAEWPSVRVRAVDLDPQEPPQSQADHVFAELWTDDTEVEVGHAGGRRLGLALEVAPPVVPPAFSLPSDSVILATGGARGITAEVCQELADRYQPTFVLVGQTNLPDRPEPGDTAGLTAPAELKRALMARLGSDGTRATVPMVERAYQQLLKEREVRKTIGALTAAGARVHYVTLDVRDEGALGGLVDDLYASYGRLDGVVHGAGIIEDKLVQDKSPESFDRVFGTKTASAFTLSRKLRPESLRFMVLFTSVAGRFGNRGQADYAAGNEVVNKLAVFLSQRWRSRVCAINWAPWDKRGMVSPELKRGFEQRGVGLLAPAAGRRAFWEEIQQRPSDGPEVVIAGSGRIGLSPTAPTVAEVTPLLKHARRGRADRGTVQYERMLDPSVDRYLDHHRLDGRAVLPLAVATELMAEAAQATWPDLTVTAVRRLQLLKGIVVEDAPVPLLVTVRPPVHGREDLATEAEVEIESPGLVPPRRYRALVELAPRLPEAPPFAPPAAALAPFPLPVADAYRRWTFHGPLFQRLTGLEGIGPYSMRGSVHSSSSASGVAGVARAAWLIDPFVFDAALQMLLMWSRAQNDKTALPSRFQAFRRHGTLSDALLTCQIHVESTAGGHALRSDVHFVDAGGRVVGVLEGMEASCTAALNRLAARQASAGEAG